MENRRSIVSHGEINFSNGTWLILLKSGVSFPFLVLPLNYRIATIIQLSTDNRNVLFYFTWEFYCAVKFSIACIYIYSVDPYLTVISMFFFWTIRGGSFVFVSCAVDPVTKRRSRVCRSSAMSRYQRSRATRGSLRCLASVQPTNLMNGNCPVLWWISDRRNSLGKSSLWDVCQWKRKERYVYIEGMLIHLNA